MLEALKFVRGAVGKKDFVPALTHYQIKDHRITSFNGTVALSCDIACDLECIPKAEPFFKAITQCEDVVKMHMTDAGRLAIASGKFKAYIECLDTEVAKPEPDGETVACNGDMLLEAFKTLQPFIGSDASRPWCNGLFLFGTSVYATNNTIVLQYYCPTDTMLRGTVIPSATVKEFLRIGKAPTHFMLSDKSISFLYPDGSWLRSALGASQWPDIDQMLGSCMKLANNLDVIPANFFDALDAIKPFADPKMPKVYLSEAMLSTHLHTDMGATYDIKLPAAGIYSLEMLQLLENVIEKADFTQYPAPCYLQGDNVRGAIVGLKI